MKLRYALLIALACLFAAPFAQASPVDPSVIVNKKGGDAITFSKNSITDPLVITLNAQGLLPLEYIDYTGPTRQNLYIALAGSLPFETFTCGPSNIFTGCDLVSTVGTAFSDDVELKFLGTLTAGTYGIQVSSAPEPATILLLLTGGAMLIGFGRKW